MFAKVGKRAYILLGGINDLVHAGSPENPYMVMVTSNRGYVMDKAFYKEWQAANNNREIQLSDIHNLESFPVPAAVKCHLMDPKTTILAFDGPSFQNNRIYW